MSKLVTQFYPCDSCSSTPYDSNEPHQYCNFCEFVGCEPCLDEHLLVEHSSDGQDFSTDENELDDSSEL